MNTSIRKIRENILTKTLGIGVFLGFIAYIPSVLAAYFANMWLVVVVDTLALLIVCVVVFLPAIPFPVKLSVFVGSSLLVGVAVIAAAGPLGAGYIWLLVAVVFSALFGRTRAIALTVAATVFIMLAWGIGVATGKLDHGVTPLIVIVISVSLFAACGLMAFVISRLISGILDAYEESQRLADRLAAELDSSNSMRDTLEKTVRVKDGLLRELQHRVRNNLQIVQSILALESSTDEAGHGSLDVVKRRIKAITIVNDLMLAQPGNDAVDAEEMIRQLLTGTELEVAELRSTGTTGTELGRGRQRGQSSKLVADTENRIVLEPQLASIVAILVGDIIASMARLSLMLEIRISSASGSLRIELRVDPSVDRIAVTSVHDDIASSRSAAGVLGEVILGYLEPEHAKGAGLYLDVCSVSHGIPRAHRRPLFDL